MKIYTLQDDIEDSLKDPKFKKAWEESEVEYQIARKLIASRLKNKLSQKELAKRAKTTQAVISRLETMRANPSIELLKRIARVMGSKLQVSI